ncbi:hypothetical protein EJB05_14553, partial [Eragrostis curvula]
KILRRCRFPPGARAAVFPVPFPVSRKDSNPTHRLRELAIFTQALARRRRHSIPHHLPGVEKNLVPYRAPPVSATAMDYYSDDSDPDLDADLQEDLDALRRSCILSGADPDAAVAQLSAASCSSYLGPSTPAASVSAAAPAAHDDSSDDDEEDEDLALVRSIRESLRLNKASPDDAGCRASSSEPRPICVWPPSDTDDDDEEDLETLRAIQRRFSHYQSGTSASSPENLKPEASLGARTECFANEPDEEFTAQKESVKGLNRTGFPKAALLLVDALKKNRACQKLIRRKMINIEAKIEENKDLRDRVKCLMGYQLSCRKSVGKFLCQKEDPRVRLITSMKQTAQGAKNKPKKMPALFLGPAENLHVSKYKMVLKQFPMSLQKRPWLDAEKDKLARGIKQQYQETLILDSMNNGSAIGDFNAVDMAYALTNAASNFDVTPESLRSVLPLINWDKIAAMYLPGRSGAECESRWLNCDDPLINHNAWTVEEEKRLLFIVQEKGMCNWINIAATLGTQRTPFQCLARYQRSLNPHIINKAWTKEEDLQLKAAVETFGDNNWQLVSTSLDGRTGSQCSNRWRKTLHPERTGRGRWSLDEDKCLMVAVKLFRSGSWNRISQFVPGRTQSQCRERWKDVLDPSLDHGEWRPEEDSKLLDAVSKLGTKWSKVAKLIPNRSDNMCLSRWRRLCQDKLPALQATNQIKKTIFQSNFVDREKERPAIGPGDLITLVHSQSDRHDENTIRGGSKNQTEEIVTVSDGLENSSRGRIRSRKKKSTPENTVGVQEIMRGCVSVDTEAVSTELKGIIGTDIQAGENGMREPVSGGEERVVKKRRRNNSVGNERAVRKRRGLDSVSNEGVVRERMRGSIPMDNEAVPMELRGSISTDIAAGENGTKEPVSVGEEGVVKKRARRTNSVGNEGAVRKRRGSKSVGKEQVVRNRMRGSIPMNNEVVPTETRGIIEAGENGMTDPVSVGEEGVVKKRTRRTNSVGKGVFTKMSGPNSVGNEGGARKRMRGSIPMDNEAVPTELRGIISTDIEAGENGMREPVSVGEEGVVKKRTRRTKSVANEGAVRKTRDSVSIENNGAVTRKKRASSRKSAENSLVADGTAIAIPGLDLPNVPSEEIILEAGNLNKGRKKSTPRPKQINMAEGDANKHSTSVRLATCLSFARMNGTGRSKT